MAFFVSISFLFCVSHAGRCYLDSIERLYCFILFSHAVDDFACFFVFVVLVDRLGAMELITRLAATLLTCTDPGELQLPAPRCSTTTRLQDTPNPSECFSFSTHCPPVLVHYCCNSVFGCCCVFFLYTPWLAWMFNPHRNHLVPPARGDFLFHLLCVIFLPAVLFRTVCALR